MKFKIGSVLNKIILFEVAIRELRVNQNNITSELFIFEYTQCHHQKLIE